MAELNRYNGNLLPFASSATGTNRTVFGDVAQSDDIDDNITSDFLTGWEIVGPSEAPTKQDFNAMAYTNSLLAAYLYQHGIAEWNTNQEYYIGGVALGSDGILYQSVIDSNTGTDPIAETDSTTWKIHSNPYSKEAVTITPSEDADYTLTALQNKYGRLVLADGSWTSAHNIIVNDTERSFIVDNSAGSYTATVKTSAGTGVAVLAGSKVELLCDGTDVIIGSQEIGVNQTWQDVTASRSAGVTYTNTTGKPIMVCIGQAYGTTGDAYFYVDGLFIRVFTEATTTTSNGGSFIVPSNSTYSFTKTSGIGTAFNLWFELR